MGVIVLNPISARASCVCDEKSYDEKGNCLELEAEAETLGGSVAEVDWTTGGAFSASVEEASWIGEDVVLSVDLLIEEDEEPFIFDSFNSNLLFFLEVDLAMAWIEENCFRKPWLIVKLPDEKALVDNRGTGVGKWTREGSRARYSQEKSCFSALTEIQHWW